MENSNFFKIFKGVFLALLLNIIILIVAAFFLAKTDFPEKYINTVMLISTAFSVFLGGIIASGKTTSKGWLTGLGVGIIFSIIVNLFGFLFSNEVYSFEFNNLILLIVIIFGMIGGALGINIVKDRPKKRKY